MMSVFFGGTALGRIIAGRLLMMFQVRTMLITAIVLGGFAVGMLWFSTTIPLAWIASLTGGMCLENFSFGAVHRKRSCA